MTDSISRQEESLPEFLAERARRATEGRLLAHACGGLIGGVAAAYWGGAGWYLLLSLNVCFFAFGLWGISGRTVTDEGSTARRGTLRVINVVRVLTGVAGLIAAAFLMMSLLGKAIGRVIS